MNVRRSLLVNSLVSFFCAAGSCLCLFLFWQDLNATFSRLGEQPVGTISFRYNTAQRRFVDRVLWDRLQNESPVYNGDIIRTADLSEATITFSGGDIVDLASNTLIQIFADKNAPRIDFSDGGISVNSSSGLVIASGDKRLTVNPGAILQAAAFLDGALDLAISEGAAFLENLKPQGGSGQRGGKQDAISLRAITAGDALFINAAGEEQAIPRAAALFPPSGAKLLTQSAEGLPLEFNWNRINYLPDGLTRLEVASDRSFNQAYFAENLSGSQAELVLPEGTWFWRLYPLGETQAKIPYSKLTIVSSPAPTLLSPQEGQLYTYRSRPPSLRFQWSSSPGASSYILEAADNPSLQNPALSLTVRSGAGDQQSALSSLPTEAVWHWRVTPVYGREFSGNPAASRTGSFVTKRGAELAAPVLTAPIDKALVSVWTSGRDILFSWKKDAEAVSYTLRISANRDMSSPIIERTITDTFYRYHSSETAIGPGAWYWTVRQTGVGGAVSPASPPRTFTAKRGESVQKLVFPPADYIMEENRLPGMRFTWKTNLADTHFQISNNAEFSPALLDEPAAAGMYTIYSLRAGDYYWRIRGGPETQRLQSLPRKFSVVGNLPPPELGLPKSGSLAAQDGKLVVRNGQRVDFNWEPSDGAEYYAFKLYQGENTQYPIMETAVFDTKLAVNTSAYGDGLYTWAVQGMTREKAAGSRRTGLASASTINIRHLYPVVLEYPRNGAEYAGIDASRRPGTVRWTSQESPASARFVLARDARMRNVIYSRANAPRNIVLPRLSPGDYFWTIQAKTQDGFDISSPAPFRFRVLPIPPLPTPQKRLPVDGAIIGLEQLKVSRSIAFSWGAVEGANGYMLTAFQNTGAARKTVLQTPVLRETSYTVAEVRLLGQGNFFWQVEALYVRDDKSIEQRGQLRENKLTIDIPSPPQIKTIDSGILYGN